MRGKIAAKNARNVRAEGIKRRGKPLLTARALRETHDAATPERKALGRSMDRASLATYNGGEQ